MKLSDRVRPNSEAAPWVIEEIKTLESDLENALKHFDMTMKGYQEEIEIHQQDETLLRQALEALKYHCTSKPGHEQPMFELWEALRERLGEEA